MKMEIKKLCNSVIGIINNFKTKQGIIKTKIIKIKKEKKIITKDIDCQKVFIVLKTLLQNISQISIYGEYFILKKEYIYDEIKNNILTKRIFNTLK